MKAITRNLEAMLIVALPTGAVLAALVLTLLK